MHKGKKTKALSQAKSPKNALQSRLPPITRFIPTYDNICYNLSINHLEAKRFAKPNLYIHNK